MLKRLARVVLAAALLAGWQLALVHPLQHVDEHGRFVHLADGHSGAPKSGGSKLCDMLAALTACAPSAAATVEPPVSSGQAPVPQQTGRRVAQAPPFLAQGPPALL